MTDPVAFGAWPSPITAEVLVQGAASVSEVRVDGTDIWWNEARPAEGGRTQLVRRSADGTTRELFAPFDPDPPGAGGAVAGQARNWNARTAYLEYGGGAWAVRDGVVVFADHADQRLYRTELGDAPTDAPSHAPTVGPKPLTPDPPVPRGYRWSEPTWLDDDWLVCLREDHSPEVMAAHGEARNEVVAVPLDGSAADDAGRIRVLVSGPDFVHSPAVHGDRLVWLQWNHPAMPWDGTEVVLAEVERDTDGTPLGIAHPVVVAGGPDASVVQPGFTGDGDLIFCTDRTGWWNPWRLRGAAHLNLAPANGEVGTERLEVKPVIAEGGIEAEIGGPLWVGGLRWWAEAADGRLVVSLTRDGADGLAVIDPDGVVHPTEAPFTEVAQVVAGPASEGDVTAVVVAASPVGEPAPHRIRLEPARSVDALRPPRNLGFGSEWFSVPTHITFASGDGREAHGLFYPPVNPVAVGPDGELPPLIVTIHGGPTSAARHRLDLAKQFWTSRGFALVDVNYGGSTGYGRPYRRLLDGAWGVVDVEDAVAAARWLAEQGLVDGDRLAIRGGSAGGFTTLAALCFHDAFAVGASHYGVADLSALAADTHKFESRYLDGMVGAWPADRDVYDQRSPINHTDGFSAPLIVFQGSEDEVVPPNQAEMIVAALAEKGVPHEYLLFEGEGHGFRRADTITQAIEAELSFYGDTLGFTPAP